MTDEQRFCACENDWTDGTGICQECKLPRVAPAAPPVAEPAPQTFEEWWEVYRPQFDTYSAVGWKGVARAAWNAAKASSPVVAGGESETLK